MSIPTNSANAVTTLMSDIKRLKSKAALLEQQKIPLDELFKDLEIFEQFWAGVIAGYVEEQIQRMEGYKKVLERVQKLNIKISNVKDSQKGTAFDTLPDDYETGDY